MVMDGYYMQDPKQAIWDRINSLHLSYLQMEESPQKLDQRIKLEDCIKDYLCIAPHNQKFYFQETAEVLHRSASSKTNFSGYKASNGWNAIQLYAGNLLAQPWRKEYREIKTFSGFYKHHIEANLVGAELMFEVMGYKHEGNGVLVLEGPVCPDRVTNVSRDSLVAYVECQILKAIWEDVSSNFVISWLDVLEFRETHVCSPQHSTNALKYRLHQKHYPEQTRQTYRPTEHPVNTRHLHATTLPLLPMNHSFPPLSTRIPPQCMYAGGSCCGGNYGYAPVNAHYSCQMAPVKTQFATNGFCCTNGYGVQGMVPTGQLIELGPQLPVYDVVDGGVRARLRKNSGEAKEDNFEDWDYVYRNLESQGYSKDLGERGDVLSPTETRLKTKTTNLDETTMANMKINEALDKYKEIECDKRKESVPDNRKLVQITPTSSYENLSTHDVKKQPKPTQKPVKTKTPSKEKVVPVNTALGSRLSQNKVVDARKSKPDAPDKRKNAKETENWECKNCTYVNTKEKSICEMCSRTRSVMEEQPMEVGGSECPRCTLVNPKEVKVCVACETSLKDSPTYI